MATVTAPMVYTEAELRGCLPAGWSLVRTAAGPRSRHGDAYVFTTRDGADQDWEIVVEAQAAGRLGRIEALREAIQRVQRRGLGRKSIITG